MKKKIVKGYFNLQKTIHNYHSLLKITEHRKCDLPYRRKTKSLLSFTAASLPTHSHTSLFPLSSVSSSRGVFSISHVQQPSNVHSLSFFQFIAALFFLFRPRDYITATTLNSSRRSNRNQFHHQLTLPCVSEVSSTSTISYVSSSSQPAAALVSAT